MLNEPDLQPDAAINRWIQGILMFNFKLIHIKATEHVGPDALSRRTQAKGEDAKSDDDSWLDNITLLTFFPKIPFPHYQKPYQPQKTDPIYHPVWLPELCKNSY